MIALNRIEYANYSSIDFDMILDCALDSDSGEVSTFLNRETIYSEKHDGSFRHIYQSKYNEVFAPKFTFMKKDFEEFTHDEHRRLLSWLTSRSVTDVLTAYKDDSNVVAFECFGIWTEIQSYKLSNDQVVAITATFETTSPYAYTPLKTITKTVTTPTIFTLECFSDMENSYIYPRIIIEQDPESVVVTFNSAWASKIFTEDNYLDGTVYYDGTYYYWRKNGQNYNRQIENTSEFDTTSVLIHNRTTHIKTSIKNRVRSEKTTIDCANKVVSTNTPGVIGDDFNWNWLPLLAGTNTIEIIGNCKVTFEYREKLNVGDL